MAIITGTAGHDELTGTSDPDTIDGLGGDDTIEAGAGDDEVDGGDGDDIIDGEGGDDVIRGGAGGDYIIDRTGSGEFYGGDGSDGFEISSLHEPGVTKLLDGGGGNDSFTISVGDMAEFDLRGGAGSDTIYFNLMFGTTEVSLGTSRDTLVFFFELFPSGVQVIRYDGITVTDFREGATGDLIDWDNMLGTSLTNWDQSANPFSTGHLRLRQSGTSTLVEIDPDGGGDDYHTLIRLEHVGKTTLTAENFDGYDPTGAQAVGTTFQGTAADDTFQGTIGDDVAYGEGGSDRFEGDGGADRFEGGDGHDIMLGEVGNDYFDAGAGDDYSQAGPGDDELIGGEGNDSLSGQHGDDVIDGGAGDDQLSGGPGTDLVSGGAGNDLLYKTESGGGIVDGGVGDDFLQAVTLDPDAPLSLLGGDGNDVISIWVAHGMPSGVPVQIDGGAGDDRIELRHASGPVRVTGGAGRDTIALVEHQFSFITEATLVDFEGGPWGDRFDWSLFHDLLIGWDGTTNPFEAGYVDLAQSGSDTLLTIDLDAGGVNQGAGLLARFENLAPGDLTTENLGFSPIPVITGTAKDDHLIGTSAGERIDGLGSGDTLRGGGGADLLVGGGGGDRLDGGTGIDRLYGGTGHDIYEVDQTGDKVFEREQEGIDLVRSLADFTLPDHVENLTLTGAGAIDGTGNALANTLTGNAAVNLLIGGAGNDTLNGGAAADEMRGGADDDLYIVNAGADQVVELAGQGNDTVRSSVSYSLSGHVEQLVLTGGGDTQATGNALANNLTGNNGNNRLDGGAGADAMAGGAGHDTYVVNNVADAVIEVGSSGNDSVESAVSFRLPAHVEKLILTGSLGYDGRGNSGANTITGNAGGNLLAAGGGNDVIGGGAGNDRLIGGAGQDELEGGAGDDRFYFNVAPGAADADGIVDFIDVDDAIYLLRSVFAGTGPNGTLAASAFHQGAAPADAGDRILYDAATGNIFYDSDGTGAGAAMLFATVAAGTALSHADFVIYG